MRVITGTARGRKLKTPVGYDVRPTSDQVKEAIFNIVQFDVEGRRVLDLFGGTGQLGIEAKSRGAGEVVIVDMSRDSVKLIKENVAHCQFDCRVVQADAISYLHGCGRFDLIFVDPPYDSDLAEKALNTIKEIDILSEGGIIVCETRKETPTPELEAPYKKRKEYSYGKIKLSVYTKES